MAPEDVTHWNRKMLGKENNDKGIENAHDKYCKEGKIIKENNEQIEGRKTSPKKTQ